MIRFDDDGTYCCFQSCMSFIHPLVPQVISKQRVPQMWIFFFRFVPSCAEAIQRIEKITRPFDRNSNVRLYMSGRSMKEQLSGQLVTLRMTEKQMTESVWDRI
mmetsp:Transcript_55005/g.133590  ORF Transcript_55005/g.133590 Transcript_55005/m.133590 type:complete len:103 (+) Transcript_55005:714-1022(+)